MRSLILSIIPDAEEVISYGMPAFRLNGDVIAGIMAHTKHLGYYPFSGSVLANFPEITSRYATTKSALHIPYGEVMLKGELRKLIKARISLCPVTRGQIRPSDDQKRDGKWRELGLAAPARRALVNARLFKLSDLKKVTQSELSALHGMGPSALSLLKKEMKRLGIQFKG